MIDKVNGEKYKVTGVKEQADGSFMVALDRLEGFPTTALGLVMGSGKMQETSDKFWDYDELLNESIAFMYGSPLVHCGV